MIELSTQRDKAQAAFLDLFTAVTGLPIGAYEIRGDHITSFHSRKSREMFESHCQLIRSFPGGAERCEADECARADLTMKTRREKLTLCYAGLYNQAVPVMVDGEVRAVLLYGEMQIEGEEHLQASLEKHRQAAAELGLDEEQAAELRRSLLRAKKYTPQQLETLKTVLPRVERWFYALRDNEDRVNHYVEDVSHELQTRLQAVIANAENLAVELPTLNKDEAQQMVRELLYSALAMDTVVQGLGLGCYLEEYDFRRQRIAPLVYEARHLYKAEADRRGVDIRIQLHRVDGRLPTVEISRPHLQRALNNLLHNAIKYSFRGGYGRYRYVLVTGRSAGDCYALTVANYGVGILPEEIESGAIFEDGYQGKLTRGEYRSGGGRGLSFAKDVVARHNGRIQAESVLMAGEESPEGQPHLTRFTVYLPYEQPKETQEDGQDDHMD